MSAIHSLLRRTDMQEESRLTTLRPACTSFDAYRSFAV